MIHSSVPEENRTVTMQCPHCNSVATHERGQILGHWVVCPSCRKPFAWRRARLEAGIDDHRAGSEDRPPVENDKRRST